MSEGRDAPTIRLAGKDWPIPELAIRQMEAARQLQLTSMAQLRNQLELRIDETNALLASSLKKVAAGLSQYEGVYGLDSPLFKMIEAFQAEVRTGTADVGKFNDQLNSLIRDAARLDTKPGEIRKFGEELQLVINPALGLNRSLAEMQADLARVNGDATAVQNALRGVKTEVIDLDKALAARAAQWQAQNGVFNRFDFAGSFNQKGADDAAKALAKAAQDKLDAAAKAAEVFAQKVKAVNDEVQQSFQSMFTGIMHASDIAVTGLLRGTMTWKQAFLSVLGGIWSQFAQMVEGMIVKWAAGEATKTVATLAGEQARVAAASAGAVEGQAILFAAAFKQIMADAGKTFAGVFAFLSPLMGPFAAGPAAAAGAVVAGVATGLPSFDTGAWSLPSDMVARVHKGEMIVPAQQAEQMRQGGGMSGGDIDRLVAKLVPHLKAVANASRATQRNIDNRLRTLRGAT
jgi:hypothetical protein